MKTEQLEEVLKYQFNNKDLLNKALTHSSYVREHRLGKSMCNERLEFIGDGFLDAIIGSHLYETLPDADEGRLTKTRANIVCERALAQVGGEIGLGYYIDLGKGEELSGGRERESIIADAVEAIIGAIYFDGGFSAAKDFVLRVFKEIIADSLDNNIFGDYKSAVQEKLQQHGGGSDIRYELIKEEGPDHDKTFYVRLVCDHVEMGKGKGKKKKEAEQNAAKATLESGEL